MAKSWNHLYAPLCSWENLLLALRRCRRRKRFSAAAAEFAFDWEPRLLQIQQQLQDRVWQPGPYYNFHISDPKPRQISAAPFADRVVHHAVVNVLEPLFERRFISDSYACRRGRGTHRAIARAQFFLRKHAWSLKTDIVKFFPNIDHELMMQQLRRCLKDRSLLWLLQTIVDSGQGVLDSEASKFIFPGDDLFSVLRPTGLPIGNLTSQFFANVFLDPVDHFVREELRVPGYVRYCDDLVLFGDSREQMWDYRDRLAERLQKLRLRLHPSKTHVAPANSGVRFLGIRVRRDGLRLLSSGLRRFTRKMARRDWELRMGLCEFSDIAQSIQSWIAHAGQANSKGILKSLLKRLRFRRNQGGAGQAHQ
jgi:retron-type reverse transcriptase